MKRNAQRHERVNAEFARVKVRMPEAREIKAFVRRGERILYINAAARKGANIVKVLNGRREG